MCTWRETVEISSPKHCKATNNSKPVLCPHLSINRPPTMGMNKLLIENELTNIPYLVLLRLSLESRSIEVSREDRAFLKK